MAKTKTAKEVQGTGLAVMAKIENKGLNALNEEQANALFSECFNEEGIEVTSKMMTTEDWQEVEDKEIKVIFIGDSSYVNEDGEEVDTAMFHSDYENQPNKIYTTAAKMLVSTFKRSGKGLYRVCYLGKEKGRKHSYDNFSIKLIQNFK